MAPLRNNRRVVFAAIAVVLTLAGYLAFDSKSPKPPVAQPAPGTATAPSQPAEPLPPAKPPRPALQRILFAGDSMMQGVAPIVMRELKATHPDWLLRNESQQSTGLTVKRKLDWVEKIKREIVDYQLTTVVVFLGPNDPWDIYQGRQVIRFPSPEWEALYSERVGEICEFAREKKVHLIWIGLPAMKEKRVYRGAVAQNPIFRDNMQRHGFDFISTEELIGRLDQPYTRHVIDAHGKKINVRADDGIHFSPQGLQRIAAAVVNKLDAASAP